MDPNAGNQPQMMTFKQFLASQDDSIDDQEAVRKYNEYKIEFKRQQISDFFLAHKEEEWFRSKYHPEEFGKRKEESLKALKNRKDAFFDLYYKQWLDAFSVDADKQDDIVRFLDAAVIKIEGGTDHDLKVLDQPPPSPAKIISPIRRRSRSESESQHDKSLEDSSQKKSKAIEEVERRGDQKYGESGQITEQTNNVKTAENLPKEENEDKEEKPKREEKSRKRRHEYNFDENDSGSASDSDDTEPEPAPPGVEPPATSATESAAENEKENKVEIENDSTETKTIKEDKEKAEKPEDKDKQEEKESVLDDSTEKEKEKENDNKEEKEKDTITKTYKSEPEEPSPRPLHKTYSLFMRNLAPLITKAEINALCKRYQGFLRVALADPQPDRCFYRRGWITFDRSVNIKEICWNLNNIRLRDCELAPVVNRDLTRRIRPVSGITAHKTIVKSDIKMAAKLVQMLDSRHHLWQTAIGEKTDPEKEQQSFILSKNPILENITDYLVDEASAEEDELLGTNSDPNNDQKETSTDVQLERDEKLIKVLDRLIMYLRIVYSLDYYTTTEYANEDEMPNRCGIMHARGPPPLGKITQSDLTEWENNFQQKINPLLVTPDRIVGEELANLGMKDPEVEQEKFVQANSQEIAKDKWLCPLSGKKFKGPEFVRKHIFNKHGDKLDDVKKEVVFFNNYLADPKRPQLPEPAKVNPQQPGGPGREGFNMGPAPGFQGPPQQGMMGFGQPRPPVMYGANQGQYGVSGGYSNRGGFDQYPRGAQTYPPKPRNRGSFRGSRGDPRELIQYRDLDAPDDMDFF
ncbi:serrate RNA effector molecule homolog [Saccoglossus kowalevskii]